MKGKRSFPSKAQLSESVSFVLLVIAIMFFIILSRLLILGDATSALSTSVSRNEIERVKAGADALFLMSDAQYQISLLDLAGRAVSEKSEIVVLGNTLPTVNISQEIEWRMDAMFGPGNWHMTLPFVEKLEYVTQIVIVADVSRSLCDDLNNLKRLPAIIEGINARGRPVYATLYLLGKSDCVKDGLPEIVCSDFDTPHFRCNTFQWSGRGPLVCRSVGIAGDPWKWDDEEDWGSGMVCAANNGPAGGWLNNSLSTRLGIVIGDELPGGSECGCRQLDPMLGCISDDGCVSCDVGSTSTQSVSVNRAVAAAKQNNVKVFGLFGEPCTTISAPGSYFEYICNCKPVLGNYMGYISAQTGGQSSSLANAQQINDVIENIIITTAKKPIEAIDIGSPLPRDVRIYRYEMLVPTTGNYTKAIFYTW